MPVLWRDSLPTLPCSCPSPSSRALCVVIWGSLFSVWVQLHSYLGFISQSSGSWAFSAFLPLFPMGTKLLPCISGWCFVGECFPSLTKREASFDGCGLSSWAWTASCPSSSSSGSLPVSWTWQFAAFLAGAKGFSLYETKLKAGAVGYCAVLTAAAVHSCMPAPLSESLCSFCPPIFLIWGGRGTRVCKCVWTPLGSWASSGSV